MLSLPVIVAGLLYLFLVQPWLFKRRHGVGFSCCVLGCNLTAIALTSLLRPSDPQQAIVELGSWLLPANLAVFLVPPSWIRAVSIGPNWIRGLMLSAMTFVIVPGCFETVARDLVARGVLKHESPINTVKAKGTTDWRMAHITGDEYRVPDPVLLWRSKKVPPYTSQGFKGVVVDLPKPPGVFRIICYGDSNTDGCPNRENWPQELHDLLAKEAAQGVRYEVLNAGIAGYSSYQGLMRFRQEVEIYEPDLITVSFGWNDLAQAVGKPDNDFELPPAPIVDLERWLLNYEFYLCLRYYLKIAGPDVLQSEPTLKGARVPPKMYLANMDGFLETAAEHGVDVVFLTRPHRSGQVFIQMDPSWRKWVPLYNHSLCLFGEQRGELVIDVRKYFQERTRLFADECHFEEEGHHLMAEMLLRRLRGAGKLPSGE